MHVEDIARAYIAALEADRELVHNEAFNVGLTTENYQVREIADIVQAIVPNSRIEFAPMRVRIRDAIELIAITLVGACTLQAPMDGTARRRAALRGVLLGWPLPRRF